MSLLLAINLYFKTNLTVECTQRKTTLMVPIIFEKKKFHNFLIQYTGAAGIAGNECPVDAPGMGLTKFMLFSQFFLVTFFSTF